MMELRNNNEPEKYVLMRGRYSGMADILYDATTKIFGSPNNISYSAICAEAEKFGPYYTEAYWDYRDYDLAETQYVLLWGADPVSSNANTLWYQEFKDVDPGDEAWDDVAKINPLDGAKLWEGGRPGTVGKCYGQGHWAYGKIAALDYNKRTPRGGNNNEILPADFERLSGSTARHGGVTRIKIEKA